MGVVEDVIILLEEQDEQHDSSEVYCTEVRVVHECKKAWRDGGKDKGLMVSLSQRE